MIKTIVFKFQRLLKDPPNIIWHLLFHAYNLLFVPTPVTQRYALKELDEIGQKAARTSDIQDHVVNMFCEALSAQPQLIVELGVRKGESTFVFERVAKLVEGRLISVDLKDRSKISNWDKWIPVKSDDISFAAAFPEFCRARGLTPEIDVLFIDTSHFYEHTKQEINAWFPFLAPHAMVMFHDTNLGHFYKHKNGALAVGWDNHRGVIRAIEERVGIPINEKIEFSDVHGGFMIQHVPYCNGFTILKKI